MKTLQQRLVWAMKNAEPEATQADLVRACKDYGEKISSAAVNKWLVGTPPVKFLKPAYLFAVARHCGVNAEWLALGKGTPKDTKPEIAPRRLALMQAYGRLPEELRFTIRQLIETLDRAGSERYAAWSANMAVLAAARDKKVEKA